MEKLTAEEKKANLEEYKKTIHPPREGEPLVPVRVVHPSGFWYCKTPSTGKLYIEGEELVVPESTWKNSDYHNPKRTMSGMLIRGILERTDQVRPPEAGKAATDELKALLERNRELERMLAVATGAPPPAVPLVVVEQPTKGSEEI